MILGFHFLNLFVLKSINIFIIPLKPIIDNMFRFSRSESHPFEADQCLEGEGEFKTFTIQMG